ncbi:MAG: orotate phosphoribosyltransferase [Candidatus Aminicenantes bacterium]|nr:orotate phosphoribosyltransferase [Candidatus Aminicenantes bacterium]
MILTREDILKIFKDSGALLQGHFILTSGLHSDAYFQCALVFQYPWHAETLCRGIVEHFQDDKIDVVVSPAVGGIVLGQEIARLLGVRAIFAERVDGKMTLRRGFQISPGERVLLAEDVTTTGGSVKEVLKAVETAGGDVIAVTAVVDRSGGSVEFGVPYFSLFQMEVHNFKPEACPLCQAGSAAVKPGSRGLK